MVLSSTPSSDLRGHALEDNARDVALAIQDTISASRSAPFQDSVPAIRHHHERWDGLRYPDGLAGEEAPLEAAIIGIADARDAMTTDRPYASALQLNAALHEIRAGRGKQFNPIVVDAFLTVAKRRPAEVLPPDAPIPLPAVVA